MIFWPLYIGSWQSATRHLTAEEKGIYLELLNFYYSKQQTLPVDHEALCRIAGATGKTERDAVKKIAEEFFTPGNNCLINARAEKEIAQFITKSGKQRAKALRKWEIERAKGKTNG